MDDRMDSSVASADLLHYLLGSCERDRSRRQRCKGDKEDSDERPFLVQRKREEEVEAEGKEVEDACEEGVEDACVPFAVRDEVVAVAAVVPEAESEAEIVVEVESEGIEVEFVVPVVVEPEAGSEVVVEAVGEVEKKVEAETEVEIEAAAEESAVGVERTVVEAAAGFAVEKTEMQFPVDSQSIRRR